MKTKGYKISPGTRPDPTRPARLARRVLEIWNNTKKLGGKREHIDHINLDLESILSLEIRLRLNTFENDLKFTS